MIATLLDTGSLLRNARHAAGMTQAELARRAGVTQSVVSAYESGGREPSMSTLAGLVAATGFELRVDLRRSAHGLTPLGGPLGRRVRRYRRALVATAAANGVTNVRVFGSVARGEDGPDSDLDLLVDLPNGMSLVGLARVQHDLEAVVGVRVDLVPESDLKPSVRARVEADLVAL